MLDKAVRRAEHTACSAGLVADSDNLAIVENIVTPLADKHSDKALDNVTTCVKLTGIYILIELANQMLENIAHLDAVIGLRVQIQIGTTLNRHPSLSILSIWLNISSPLKISCTSAEKP